MQRIARLGPRWWPPLTAAAGVAVVCGFPLVRLLQQSVFGTGPASLTAYRDLFQGGTLIALQNTVVVALLAAGIGLLAGATAALLIQRSDLPCRRAFGLFVLLPLLMPPFVQAVSSLDAYARGGLTFNWWGVSADWLQGAAGVTLLLAIQTSPLTYLLVGARLQSDRGAQLEEAARAAGAGQWRALLGVTLPRLLPALTAAGTVAFISAASDFGVPAVLGIPAGFTVVTTLIYRRLSLSASAVAFTQMIALSALLAAVSVMAIVAAALLSRPAQQSAQTAEGDPQGQLRLGAARWPVALAGAVLVSLTGVLPLVALALRALSSTFNPSLAPPSWSREHFEAALAHGGLEALVHSAALAAGAAAIVAAGGALVAGASRGRGWFGAGIMGLACLPFALPGSVVAVAAILAWQPWFYGTFTIILLAYVARFAVLGVRAADVGLSAVPEELSEAARAAGAGRWRVAFDIQRPLVQPVLLAAFVLAFLLAVHELTVSSLLYTPATETIAIQVLNAEQAGDPSVTAALSMIVLALTLAAALPLALSRRLRRFVGVELSG